jgi:hypothetical protein
LIAQPEGHPVSVWIANEQRRTLGATCHHLQPNWQAACRSRDAPVGTNHLILGDTIYEVSFSLGIPAEVRARIDRVFSTFEPLPSRELMPRPTIQLLVFKGCPLAAAARQSLRRALDELGLPTFEEIDILDASTPDELRAWGSPTILVDGEDVSGSPKGNSIACRVYAEPNGVPTPKTIAACIMAKLR